MNKKEAEKKIRELATQVCVKHEEPDEAMMAELNEAGYRVERMTLHYLDGIFATFPDGSMHYATKTQTTRGNQNRCALYEAEDVHRFETCTRMLTEAEQPRHVYTVDCYADAIKADGLRNQIKEACEQMRTMMAGKEDEPEPIEPGQDDETPLECYDGFDSEPAKPEPVENPLEWLKRAHEGITVSRKNERACWWVSGNTKPMKEKLKAMGFKWAPKKKMWYLKPQMA